MRDDEEVSGGGVADSEDDTEDEVTDGLVLEFEEEVSAGDVVFSEDDTEDDTAAAVAGETVADVEEEIVAVDSEVLPSKPTETTMETMGEEDA